MILARVRAPIEIEPAIAVQQFFCLVWRDIQGDSKQGGLNIAPNDGSKDFQYVITRFELEGCPICGQQKMVIANKPVFADEHTTSSRKGVIAIDPDVEILHGFATAEANEVPTWPVHRSG